MRKNQQHRNLDTPTSFVQANNAIEEINKSNNI